MIVSVLLLFPPLILLYSDGILGGWSLSIKITLPKFLWFPPTSAFPWDSKNGQHLQEIMAGRQKSWDIYSYSHCSGQFLLGNLLPGLEVTGFWGSFSSSAPSSLWVAMTSHLLLVLISLLTCLWIISSLKPLTLIDEWTVFIWDLMIPKSQATFIFHFRSTGRKTVLWNSYPTIFSLIMTIKIKLFKAFALVLCGKPCNSKCFINLIKSS